MRRKGAVPAPPATVPGMALPAVATAAHDLIVGPLGRARVDARRRRLVGEAGGRVLEVGASDGRNLAHYRDIARLTVLEPDARRRRRLAARAGTAPVPVDVRPVALDEALLDEAAFDTIVCTFSLCMVRDAPAALVAARRALAPGGRLLFLEHERARGLRGRLQRAATPAWRRLTRGCHLDRSTVEALWRGGFLVTDCERVRLRGWAVRGWLVQGGARVRRAPHRAPVAGAAAARSTGS